MPDPQPSGHSQDAAQPAFQPPVQELAFALEDQPAPATAAGARILAAARRFHQRTGHLNVPSTWQEDDVRLGSALERVRADHRRGRADPALLRGLEQLGFCSDPRRVKEERNRAAATHYAQLHGHLLPHGNEVLHHDGRTIAIGQLMHRWRRAAERAAHPDRVDQLNALGVPWLPPERLTAPAYRRLVELQHLLEGGQEIRHLSSSRTTEDTFNWLRRQLSSWDRLGDGQRSVLQAVIGGPEAFAHPRVDLSSRRFDELVAACRQYLTDTGTLYGPDATLFVHRDYHAQVGTALIPLHHRLTQYTRNWQALTSRQHTVLTRLGLPTAPLAAKSAEPYGTLADPLAAHTTPAAAAPARPAPAPPAPGLGHRSWQESGKFGAAGISGGTALARQLDRLAPDGPRQPVTTRRGLAVRLRYLLWENQGLPWLRAAGVTVTERTLAQWTRGTRTPASPNLLLIDRAFWAFHRHTVADDLKRRLWGEGTGTRIEIYPVDQSTVAPNRHRDLNVRTKNVRREWEHIVDAWHHGDQGALERAWENITTDLGSDGAGYLNVTHVGFGA